MRSKVSTIVKALVLSIVILATTIFPNNIISNVVVVEADEYDDWLYEEDDDWDDLDEDDDYYYEDDEDYYDDDYDDKKEYNYNNVKKTFNIVSLSQSTEKNYSKTTLGDGKTNVYPVNVEKTADYIIGLTNESYGEGSILVVDAKGNVIYEKELDLQFKSWKKTLSLSKGKYYIKILSKFSIGLEYELYIKPAVTVKKETKNIKMSSCHTKKLEPKLGKGSWTTSNKNIVSIDNKNPKDSSTCIVRAKKAGSATITYKNDSGSILKYKITVSSKSTNPLEDAYFSMDSVGGLKPTIFIANNSEKRIKYIYLTASFYNAVGDKLKNQIGGYSSAKLQITGFINPWENAWYEWDPVFYEYTATKMKIETMQVVYADGSKKTMTPNKKYPIY